MCFEMGSPLRWRRGWSFHIGTTFVAPEFQHDYIRSVTASSSLQTLCILWHCTILSNIYTRYNRGVLSMQTYTRSYALIYVTTLKLHWSGLIIQFQHGPHKTPHHSHLPVLTPLFWLSAIMSEYNKLIRHVTTPVHDSWSYSRYT
jgi:hypothetical protein